MRVLAVVHQDDAGPGVFADVVGERGHELELWRPFAGDVRPRGGPDAAMVFGGAMHVDQEDRHPWLRGEKRELAALLDAGVPTLGVCLGSQLVAELAGAPVGRAAAPEIGWFEVEREPAAEHDPVLGPLPDRFEAFQWHSYEFGLPPGGLALARSADRLQAFRAGEVAWGIQFHAEVTPAIARHWIDDYRADGDAVAIGLDPQRLRAQTNERIAAWNELGRALCGGFLDVAEGI
jgi:GMP synthase (glutamine-hydrolysing)